MLEPVDNPDLVTRVELGMPTGPYQRSDLFTRRIAELDSKLWCPQHLEGDRPRTRNA